MSAGLRFIFALARLFALPLSILIAVRLGYLDIKDSYTNILWIALLLGLVNLLVRPFVLVLLLLLSLPLFIVLRLPKVLMTGLITFGLLYLTNVLMLKLVCNLLGLPLGSPWLASLAISVGSWFISYSTAPAAQRGPGTDGQSKPKQEDAIDI
ncbi:MAG: hypothetical protein K9M83_03435 [Opitutales bacterium]|jgi:hypothetical protein|nr:hypothetical protein [Opitutales bacterium]